MIRTERRSPATINNLWPHLHQQTTPATDERARARAGYARFRKESSPENQRRVLGALTRRRYCTEVYIRSITFRLKYCELCLYFRHRYNKLVPFVGLIL